MRLASILASAVLLLALVPVVTGTEPLIPCSNPTVTLYENGNQGGDSVKFCNTNVSNLANVPHVPPGGCAKRIGESSTWNDCVSSIRITYLPSNRCFSIYDEAGYDVEFYSVHGPQSAWSVTFQGLYNDGASSFRFYAC